MSQDTDGHVIWVVLARDCGTRPRGAAIQAFGPERVRVVTWRMSESDAQNVQQRLEGAMVGRYTSNLAPRFEVVAVSESLPAFVATEWLANVPASNAIECSGLCGPRRVSTTDGIMVVLSGMDPHCPLHGRGAPLQLQP